MDRLFERVPALSVILWILAGLIAIVIVVAFTPVSLFAPAPTPTARPVFVAKSTQPARASSTPVAPSANISFPPPVSARTPLPTPTLAANAKAYTFTADLKRTGWLTSKETGIHWGDRNLHVGTFKDQVFQTLVLFDVKDLIPGSKILYAQIELTGLNRNNLAQSGAWTLKLLPTNLLTGWALRPASDFRDARPLLTVNPTLKPEDLAEDRVNQFIFAGTQLNLLADVVDAHGQIALRLDGPAETTDNLFTWDGGNTNVNARPLLSVIAIPGQFVYVTQTPTPQSVLTAAAIAVKSTADAKQFGTPTPLPRKFATMPPLVPITPQPTPANLETVTAHALYATAVAMTTGTFTPTPLNWVTTTPLPLVVPAYHLSPTPTLTPTPTPLPIPQAAKRTLPADLYNKIMFQRGPRHAPAIWVMDPDGTNLGLVTDRAVYETATARDTLSPDGVFQAFNGADPNRPDTLQILRADLRQPRLTPQTLTVLRSGIAFAPAWSPEGTRLAYTSTETGRHEIWILDVNTRAARQITFSTDWFWNQFPSWSPDGKQIVFSSDRGHNGAFTEIWLMNADGNALRKLGDGVQDAWGPVWVKWK